MIFLFLMHYMYLSMGKIHTSILEFWILLGFERDTDSIDRTVATGPPLHHVSIPGEQTWSGLFKKS